MAIIGIRAAVDLVFPAGIDTGKIFTFQNRSGRTAESIISEAAAAVGAANTELLNTYGGIVRFTPSLYAYYRDNDGNGRRMTPRKVEGVINQPVRGSMNGHMLPMFDYEDTLAWTALYLRDAWDEQIEADLQVIVSNWIDRVDYDIWTRIFSTTENLIGTGYDVPWAIGTGTNVNYIPPRNGSYAFDSTHTHFMRVNSAISSANCATALSNAVGNLREHSIGGRLVLFVSEADISYWTGVTNFVKPVPAGVITTGGATTTPTYTETREATGLPGEPLGLIIDAKYQNVIEVRAHVRIPTTYGWLTKSYGSNAGMNALAIREHPAVGFGLVPDPQVTPSVNPQLDTVIFKGTHGVGVNDRLNGVAFQVATGGATYSAPEIS